MPDNAACALAECLSSAKLRVRSGAYEIWTGHLDDGPPFSAIVNDNRSGTHLHFPAADVLYSINPLVWSAAGA